MKESMKPTVLSALSAPAMVCISLDGVQKTSSKSWTDINDTFYLQVQLGEGVTAMTVMADLALGVAYGGSSGDSTYFRIKVTGPSNSVGYATAAQDKHSSNGRNPIFVRGFYQMSGQPNDVFTFTPQWQVSGDTSTIDQPQAGTISNFFSVTAIVNEEGFVQGSGANS